MDIPDKQISPTKPEQIARVIAHTWNALNKTHGWHNPKTPENLLRTPHLIKSIQKLAQKFEITTQEKPNLNEIFHRILSQWNWEKTPAPLQILYSENKWKALEYEIQKTQEEQNSLKEEHLQRLRQTTKKEWLQQRKTTTCPTEATRKTEEYLRASGRWGTFTPTEKLAICQELETLTQTTPNTPATP
jgi:hypothetical protein